MKTFGWMLEIICLWKLGVKECMWFACLSSASYTWLCVVTGSGFINRVLNIDVHVPRFLGFSHLSGLKASSVVFLQSGWNEGKLWLRELKNLRFLQRCSVDVVLDLQVIYERCPFFLSKTDISLAKLWFFLKWYKWRRSRHYRGPTL